MTFDECHKALIEARRKQGTRCPIIRVDAGGSTYRGRLRRADSDPEHRRLAAVETRGVLEVEQGAHGRAVVPIDAIPADGIRGD